MKIGLKKIDTSYDVPIEHVKRTIIEFKNNNGIFPTIKIIQRSGDISLEWSELDDLVIISYLDDGTTERDEFSVCTGKWFPVNNTNNDALTVTFEFTDGHKATYRLPEQGEQLKNGLLRYYNSEYNIIPGSDPDMARAAELLDTYDDLEI